MPWWGWVILGFVALVGLLGHSVSHYRRGIRREFIAHLRGTDPELEIVDERNAYIDVRSKTLGDGRIYLDRIYTTLSNQKSQDLIDRLPVYEHFAKVGREGAEALERLTLDRHGTRILPRLVTPEYFRGLPPGAKVPNRPLGETGLSVVYVLDLENSVAYVTGDHMVDLGIDEAALHELALSNLRKLFPVSIVRGTLEKRVMTNVVGPDTFEAARIVLVPEYLRDGEQIVAFIPDRDTLLLVAPPPEQDLGDLADSLAAMPRGGDERPLLRRPIRVTRAGFELI